MTDGLSAIETALGNAAPAYYVPGQVVSEEALDLLLSDKDLNDYGNAMRFLARHGNDVLFVEEVGWLYWDGKRWTPDGALAEVKRRAHQTAQLIAAEVGVLQETGPLERGKGETESKHVWADRVERLFKWYVTSGNRPKLDAMIAEVTPYLSVTPEKMDADPYLINVRNGTLVLDRDADGDMIQMREHDRADRLAKLMDVEYDPSAECPTFKRFLETSQPDAGIRDFLQVWSGYCLTGVTGEQKLVFNFGEGGNGKSVFIDLIAKMMGPYSVSLPFASLLRDDRKRGAEATPDLARLPGARLVRASEPEKGSRFAEATIKSITGGEEITVRHLNHGFFDFVPQFKLTLSGNHKPAIRGQDRGIWRRFILVPWEQNIPEKDQDKQLPAKLWAERAGVLNWLLDGARIWLEKGLVVPDSIKAATDEYREDSDPLGRFLRECVREAPGCSVQASVMYGAYVDWCKVNAERPWSQTAFGRALPDKGFKRSDGRIRVYLNTELVEVPTSSGGEPPYAQDEGDYGH
jgi:putative DNA primase/helicase